MRLVSKQYFLNVIILFTRYPFQSEKNGGRSRWISIVKVVRDLRDYRGKE
jgi:hypothetical protein